ncbi:hypothetical protein [Parvibaculum sp.]|uniref:hypothetical protein n=1 Tax=Parvibaculum sp. TaxID=2024848 RepID=UPI001DC4D752|nr:hypothetical protein [Parvibaculum sp.]MBX3490891.1 hypothetical protein [Parvibaculum sp.]
MAKPSKTRARPAPKKTARATPKAKKVANPKGGRPSHEPTAATRAAVKSMGGTGTPQENIARHIGIDSKTLRLHYRDELDLSLIQANHNIGVKLYEKAMDGDLGALIWWDKTRGGKSEKVRFGGAVGVLKFDPEKLQGMTDAELSVLETALAKLQ